MQCRLSVSVYLIRICTSCKKLLHYLQSTWWSRIIFNILKGEEEWWRDYSYLLPNARQSFRHRPDTPPWILGAYYPVTRSPSRPPLPLRNNKDPLCPHLRCSCELAGTEEQLPITLIHLDWRVHWIQAHRCAAECRWIALCFRLEHLLLCPPLILAQPEIPWLARFHLDWKRGREGGYRGEGLSSYTSFSCPASHDGTKRFSNAV